MPMRYILFCAVLAGCGTNHIAIIIDAVISSLIGIPANLTIPSIIIPSVLMTIWFVSYFYYCLQQED